MRRSLDVIIIGGSVAGSSAAIRLALSGKRVCLYEKARFPRPKLCGGFLSPEVLDDLSILGILDRLYAVGAIPIRRITMVSPKGRTVNIPLPQPGLSLSRKRLDMILLQRAREVGAEVHEGADGWPHAGEAPWTLIATGRRMVAPHDRQEGRYFGVQALFHSMEDVTDQVELNWFAEGYIGWVRQNEGVNLCALLRSGMLERYGPNLDHVMASLIGRNPQLKQRYTRARRISRWQAVGPVQIGFRTLGEGSKLFIGDAACVVDPFVGEGMTMAIRASHLVAKAFSGPGASVSETYSRLWHETFGSSLRYQSYLHALLRNAFSKSILLESAGLFPPLLRELTSATRIPAYAES